MIGDPDTTGPGFVDIIGGNIGASSKGKTQITTHAIDFQNVGQAKVTSAAISQGGSVSGAAINIPTASLAKFGIHINDNRFKIGGGNFAVNGTDNTAQVTICDNDFQQAQGIVATGGYIQQGGVVSGPPLGTGGNWIARNNLGFNPFGWFATVTGVIGANVLTNTYGVPATYYVSAGAGGTISEIDIYKNDGVTTVDTKLTAGAFYLEPGGMLKVTAATVAPHIVIVGN